MSCNTFHLVNSDDGCYAIQRGVDLGVPPANAGIAFFVKNTDLTGWTPIGQIRNNYASLAPTPLASFTFSIPTYDTFTLADGSTVTGTKIVMKMGALTTKTLPPTPKFAGVEITKGTTVVSAIGITALVYDVRVIHPSGESAGVFSLVSPSCVQVVDDVSELANG